MHATNSVTVANPGKRWVILLAVGVVSILVIIIAIIIASFSYLDYDQLGLKRQKSTAKVFTDKVYTNGRYFWGPDFDFKVYPASASSVILKGVTVFSKDALEVSLDVQFHYFIRPQQLGILHRKYQLTYDSVIRNSAMDALKAAAVDFTTEQFIRDRNPIEVAMEEAVRKRIGGKCCEANCTKDKCVDKCIPLETCTKEADMGLMVNMRYFSLTKTEMPYAVYYRYLGALLLTERAKQAEYNQEKALVEKEVDEAVKAIDNEVNETLQNAMSLARLTEQKANAESLKIIGTARSDGLTTLMRKCAVADARLKMSLHYLNTLGASSKAHMAVDFKNFVIGSP